MNFEQQILTLSTDNGAIAAKLRQMTTELASQLRARGCEVTGIRVQVQVCPPRHVEPHQPHELSQAGLDQVAKFAESLTDSPLKEVLKRLARQK